MLLNLWTNLVLIRSPRILIYWQKNENYLDNLIMTPKDFSIVLKQCLLLAASINLTLLSFQYGCNGSRITHQRYVISISLNWEGQKACREVK